jgi:hypothetical protein
MTPTGCLSAAMQSNVTEENRRAPGGSGSEATGAEDLDGLGEMQVGTDDPSAVHPSAKVGSEQGVRLAQSVGQKDRDVPNRKAVTETMDEGRGVGGFARREQVAKDEFRFRFNGEPETGSGRGGADAGVDLVHLQERKHECPDQHDCPRSFVCI